MRLRPPRTTPPATRPGERYLAAGAEEARLLGHAYVGTEHVLLALTRDPATGSAQALLRLGVTHHDIASTTCLASLWPPPIDPAALATLGIDLDTVRDRLDEVFGPGALEQTSAGLPAHRRVGVECIAPRLKEALSRAVDRAGERSLADEDVLLGMLEVHESLAARALGELGVSLETAEAAIGARH